ncbi:nicotinate (nicotinamide) nucleotide adenylyltransferase [Rhodoferax sp.]|uniref:nicotinate (nicotinamide) nucleotide adenylyltransferase n=1 Tax=Rhodoferax sp. TaxID=50421 RepID=UPI0025DFC372|nr:nicotinate (nicotinamide) nucleotide adenylyltransferase [Rhodoferax sp.]
MNESLSVPGRIGVFGGAFDPPHLGHMALVKTAMVQLGLQRLVVVPTGQAWHKTRPLSAAHHRVAMAELAFASIPGVSVDRRETLRHGPSYTVDTLRELQSEIPGQQWHLVIGEDQARRLSTWHEADQLPALAIICVAARADSSGAQGQFDGLADNIPGLTVLNMPAMAISATDIRQRVASGESIAPLVFEPVARYIDQHLLYRSD